jgi:hypothetical protein
MDNVVYGGDVEPSCGNVRSEEDRVRGRFEPTMKGGGVMLHRK